MHAPLSLRATLSSSRGRRILAVSLLVAAASVAAAFTLRARMGAVHDGAASGPIARASAFGPSGTAGEVACPVQLRRFQVRGTSMEGVLPPGTDVAAEMGYFACHPPARGDVAVITFPWRADPIIKQVLTLPGDHIALSPGPAGARLLVNGAVLTTPAGVPYAFAGKREQMLRLYVDQFRGVMPAGVYFVFGTEPSGSLDSSQFGPVERSALVGRAIVR